MTSFYDDPTTFPYIERAILMEDVKLPIYNKKKKLTHSFFYTMTHFLGSYNPYVDKWCDAFAKSEEEKEYKLAYNELKNIDAKFYIPVLMTTFNKSDTEVKINNKAPSKAGFKGNIQSLSYSSTNCAVLTIPKYILLQFIDQKNDIVGVSDPYIPKGTEFLVACVGGYMEITQMRIIGIYTLTYDKHEFPNLKDKYYGGNNVK